MLLAVISLDGLPLCFPFTPSITDWTAAGIEVSTSFPPITSTGRTRGFAGGQNGRRLQTRVMPVYDVEEDESQTQCQGLHFEKCVMN